MSKTKPSNKAILLALGLTLGVAASASASISYDGQTYDITTDATTFKDSEKALEASPIWKDQALADALAELYAGASKQNPVYFVYLDPKTKKDKYVYAYKDPNGKISEVTEMPARLSEGTQYNYAIVTAVPEASTGFAGAMLGLPFGVRCLREVLRQRRKG